MKRQHDKDIIDVPYEVVEVNDERFKVDVTPLVSRLPMPKFRNTKEALTQVPAVTELPIWEDG